MHRYDFVARVEQADGAELERELGQKRLDAYHYLLLVHGIDCRRGRPEKERRAHVVHKDLVHLRGKHGDPPRYTRAVIRGPGGSRELMKALGLDGLPEEALSVFQAREPGPALIEFTFTLATAFLSRDDAPFYPIDNPVRKERIFRVPMIAGASWKGALRWAAVENLVLREGTPEEKGRERAALVDLFGDEKGAEEEGEQRKKTLAAYLDARRIPRGREEGNEVRRRGRLRCLPSYFDDIDADVINPRSRNTRAGTVPVCLETVPAGATGRFSLLYLPFDLLGQGASEIERQRKRDWDLIGGALYRMFRITGFGAKKSIGCGAARAELIDVRIEPWPMGDARLPGRMEDLIGAGRYFDGGGE